MRRVKDVLICLLLITGTWALIEISRTARAVTRATDGLSDLALSASTTLEDIRDSAAEFRGYNKAMAAQLSDSKTQRGIGLLLRSGDDLARLIKRSNVVLEGLNDAIRITSASINERLVEHAILAIDRTSDSVNDKALAELERTLKASTSAIGDMATAIKDSSVRMDRTWDDIQGSVKGIEERIRDPRFDLIIGNINEATAHANASLMHIETKTKELIKPVSWIWRGIKSGIVVVGRIFIP